MIVCACVSFHLVFEGGFRHLIVFVSDSCLSIHFALSRSFLSL